MGGGGVPWLLIFIHPPHLSDVSTRSVLRVLKAHDSWTQRLTALAPRKPAAVQSLLTLLGHLPTYLLGTDVVPSAPRLRDRLLACLQKWIGLCGCVCR